MSTNHLSNPEYIAAWMQQTCAQRYSDAMYCRQRASESSQSNPAIVTYYHELALETQAAAAVEWQYMRNYLDSIK